LLKHLKQEKVFDLNIRILAMAVALLPASVSVALAGVVQVSVTGPDPAYSFALTSSPVIGGGNYFKDFDFKTAGYTFYSTSGGGGFSTALLQYFGPQLFRGPESRPTFHAGAYRLLNSMTQNIDTLTMTVEVPELSTWTMMLAGFCGLVFAGYRRNKTATLVA
jgi:hypothetical protein